MQFILIVLLIVLIVSSYLEIENIAQYCHAINYLLSQLNSLIKNILYIHTNLQYAVVK